MPEDKDIAMIWALEGHEPNLPVLVQTRTRTKAQTLTHTHAHTTDNVKICMCTFSWQIAKYCDLAEFLCQTDTGMVRVTTLRVRSFNFHKHTYVACACCFSGNLTRVLGTQ